MKIDQLLDKGYKLIQDYYYDEIHHSIIMSKDDICIILDDDICNNKESLFEYSKYCEMQNNYVFRFSKLIRVNLNDNDKILEEVEKWTNKDVTQIILEDKGGTFSESHIDNTPLEKEFEDVFAATYGDEASIYLNKEYAISLEEGRNAFVDYVIETKSGNYAIEENGVKYHHPCLIGDVAYNKQLEKQNTLSLLGFKVYRFSSENIKFRDQTIDNIRKYLGDKKTFLKSTYLKEERGFCLYEHQKNTLELLDKSRKEGKKTALVVFPTGTGKSQIAIEDLFGLFESDFIHKALILVPTVKLRNDWDDRLKEFKYKNLIDIKFYNTAFIERNVLPKNYYDYIVFDEAHHAQAANCKKTLQYYNPKFLLGLTATPDRLDKKKLEDIFGKYESELTLKEAIEKKVITNIRCYRLVSNIDLSKVRYNGKDYNNSDLEKTLVVDSRNELIVKTIKKYFEPRDNFFKQGIVFCVNIAHCKKLERMFTEAGLSAIAVYGSNKNNDQIFEDYRNKKIQFLLSCQIISEGWDSPQTEVVVMARPTLSKVLYLQQIGRGVRNYPGKECLYVIDVVDNYDSKLTPWNFNSLFHIGNYSDFVGVINNNFDYLNILGLSENEISMQEVDVFTFEEKYKGYLSLEQAARELFIGTNTLAKWVKLKPNYSSLYLPIGSKIMPYFSSENINNIRKDKKIGIHDDNTILDDFIDFINENTLTFSFKLIFMLGMLTLGDKEGEVNIDKLLDYYTSFYLDRINRNLPIDRPNCIYDEQYLCDRTKMKKSLLDNPFEKFERKRFVYFSKDLNIICFNPNLWSKLTNDIKESIINKEKFFLKEYYKNYGGM